MASSSVGTQVTQDQINQAVLKLDAWFDTMRTKNGYGGPVVHWWQNSLQFTGAGLDWRYEGIITGYLNLFHNTGERRWLDKAKRAANDLVGGQLPSGNFRNSSFELNPHSGGTPHEAACALAILGLGQALREAGQDDWLKYVESAEDNLLNYHVARLWNEEAQAFGNSPENPTITPNKSATISEALLALARIKGEQSLIEEYILLTLDTIVKHQVVAPGNMLHGAIDQSSVSGRKSGRFFPFYVARCVPALLQGFDFSGDYRYFEAANRALDFVVRVRLADGSYPQLLYDNGRVNTYPRWIAGIGDILSALNLGREAGIEPDFGNSVSRLLDGQEKSGAIRTAFGFAVRVRQKSPPASPDFQDLLPVCGWVDKAFNFLTSQASADLPIGSVSVEAIDLDSTFRNQNVRYHEDDRCICLMRDEETIYRWRKGTPWADVCTLGPEVK